MNVEQYLTTPQRLYTVHRDTKVLASLETFLNGQRHGPHITWYCTGKIQSERRYVHGSLDGKIKFYREDGLLVQETEYIRSFKNGRHWMLNRDGSYNDDLYFIMGRREGECLWDQPEFNFVSPGIGFREIDQSLFKLFSIEDKVQ